MIVSFFETPSYVKRNKRLALSNEFNENAFSFFDSFRFQSFTDLFTQTMTFYFDTLIYSIAFFMLFNMNAGFLDIKKKNH